MHAFGLQEEAGKLNKPAQAQSMQTHELEFKPGTFLLWDDSAKHFTTVPSMHGPQVC